MKISQISTQTVFGNLRTSALRLQQELNQAQKEAVHGSAADTGLHLGTGSGQYVSLTTSIERLNRIVDTNDLARSRLDVTLQAIGTVSDNGQELLSALTVGMGQSSDNAIIAKAGEIALDSMAAAMNATYNGQYVFGGINSDQQVIADFETGGGKAALETAFQTHFGFPKTAPAAGFISTADMRTFIDTVVQPMFDGADWGTYFSNASDDVITARIGFEETIDSSISANETGFRNMFFAAAITTTFFEGAVGAAATSAVSERAIELVAGSSGNLAALQGRVGYITNRVQDSTDRISRQIDSFTLASNDMVAVDPYEAATRVNQLLTQIETSYTLTGRIQQLSLMRFI